MIKLYQFAPAFGLPNASPFCMKLENYLRMVELPYEIAPPSLRDFSRAPGGKLPFAEVEGKLLGDSTLIIEHLKATHGDPLDAWLSPEQKAVALAWQRLMEENLYWAVLYSRWVAPSGWPITKAAFFAHMPVPLRWLLPALVRRSMVKSLHGHGMGRHTEAQIDSIGQRDITALADFLNTKPFMMGDAPCSLDATAYAFFVNLIWAPIESPLKQHCKQHPQLEAYCHRMRSRYYG